MKKTRMKRILYILILLLISVSISSQQLPTIKNLLSPNAASLGNFGDIPVSLYTGNTNIQIPVYTIETQNLKIPIVLDYYSTGIRPDQHSGWVGTNWSLQAGGAISRIVKEYRDEYDNPYAFGGSKAGFLWNYEFKADWTSENNLLDRMDNSITKDSEPDEFIFNFLNYHGTFYLDANGNWNVKSDNSIKVIFDKDKDLITVPFDGYKLQTKVISGFTLITNDGVQYKFGYDQNAIEYSIPVKYGSGAEWNADSWYLVEIKHPKEESVWFEYERDNNFISQLYTSFSQVSSSGKSGLVKCSDYISSSVVKHGQIISPVYLKNIVSPATKILFSRSQTSELRYAMDNYPFLYSQITNYNYDLAIRNYYPYLYKSGSNIYDPSGNGHINIDDDILPGTSPQSFGIANIQWQKLDNIKIYSNIGTETLINKFDFKYNNIKEERLFLEEFIEKGNTDNDIKRYSFSYHKKEDIPPYLSTKIDHWGFFNNTAAYLSDKDFYFKNRSKVDSESLKIGILTKIQYPTGGYIEFEYEPHEYSKELQLTRWLAPKNIESDKLSGGLRIKKISNFDLNNTSIKEYEYKLENSNRSSGLLSGVVSYTISDYRVKSVGDKVDAYYTRNGFQTQTVLPNSANSINSHIRYSRVVEKRSDGSYSVYKYTNFDNGHLDDPYEATLESVSQELKPYNSKEEERGKLISKEDYNKGNELIHSITTEYSSIGGDSNIKGINGYRALFCIERNLSYTEATAYKVYTYSYLPVIETEIFYDPISKQKTETVRNIFYNKYKQMISTESLASNGDKLKEHYQYTSDYIDGLAEYQNEKNKNCKTTLDQTLKQIEKTYEEGKKSCGYDGWGIPSQQVQECLHKLEQVYKRDKIAAEERSKNCIATESTNIKNGIIAKYARDYNGLSYLVSKNTLINKKDNNKWYLLNSNIIEYHYNFEKNYILPSYHKRMELLLPTEVSNPNKFYTGIGYIDSRYVAELTYDLYDNMGNLLQKTSKDKVVISYLWSYKGQYPVAEVVNATYDQIKTALGVTPESISSSLSPDMTKIDILREKLPEAQVTTYKYKPLIGMTQKTDPRGVTTYYDYDSFGRLKESYIKEEGKKRIIQSYNYHYQNQ